MFYLNEAFISFNSDSSRSRRSTNDINNLMSLCNSCHSRIIVKMDDRWGRSNLHILT
ncbi:MAG: HNH endonuclease [Eubacteriales bacterium]